MAMFNTSPQSYVNPVPLWQQQTVPTQTQPATTFIWIQGGDAAANAYPVQPGNTVRLMDADNPVLYEKSVDFTGKPSIKIYDLVLRNGSQTTQPSQQEYVTKNEIAEIVANTVRQEMSQFNHRNNKQGKKEVSDNG